MGWWFCVLCRQRPNRKTSSAQPFCQNASLKITVLSLTVPVRGLIFAFQVPYTKGPSLVLVRRHLQAKPNICACCLWFFIQILFVEPSIVVLLEAYCLVVSASYLLSACFAHAR